MMVDKMQKNSEVINDLRSRLQEAKDKSDAIGAPSPYWGSGKQKSRVDSYCEEKEIHKLNFALDEATKELSRYINKVPGQIKEEILEKINKKYFKNIL